MTDSCDNCSDVGEARKKRKPRIALVGEFSAGKSTLMNLLLGCEPLPVQITATQAPPVRISYGERPASRELLDGTLEPLESDDLTGAPFEGTRLIRLFLEADVLQLCDLFDIPGISDPNIAHSDWSNLMEEIDSVIWCTHANQAWRQSEAALWEQLSKQTSGNNILVVTQFDKLKSERDKSRVLNRLKLEAGDAFEAIFPLATLEALEAGDDEDIWIGSGGAALAEHLVEMLIEMEGVPKRSDVSLVLDDADSKDLQAPVAKKNAIDIGEPKEEKLSEDGATFPLFVNDDSAKVVPRRVRPTSDEPERPTKASVFPAATDVTLVAQGDAE